MSDLDIIRKLEKVIGKELPKIDRNKIRSSSDPGYSMDDKGRVFEICLDDCELYNLPSEIYQLKNLQGISAHSNQLPDLPLELCDLTSLKYLYLTENQISSIPSEIERLTSLEILSLAFNQITSLPQELCNLVKLDYLDLSDNPLKSPPLEIAQKSITAIREYFESLKHGERPLNEVKLLLVGEGSAGKTSLMKRILNEEFDPDEDQTDGITIEPWKFKENGTDITANMWDFGGQHIMHATHQFFLSKRSLYVLVLDVRKDPKAEYWLKHIDSFGGDSPILVVLNKIDENPGFMVNEQFLKSKYNNIKGFYRLSCSKRTGISKFKKALQRQLTKVEMIQTTWGESWFSVKSELEKMRERKQDFISHDMYNEICELHGVNKKSAQDTLVNFLNDLGTVVHFSEFELGTVHVIDPKWVTDGVYKIINSQILADCKGVLDLCRLDEILKQEKESDYFYPYDKYQYIIELMKKFELCYKFDRDPPAILIPSLLDVQEPITDFDYDNSLRFRIDYDFLPISVIHRFIVKMHRDVKQQDGVPLHWRTGVVLQDETFQSTAVVKADEEDKKIYIYVAGEQKRDYLAVIRFTFRDINNSFEKMKVTEKICLPDNPDVTVGYDHLLKLENMGVEEYMPEGADDEYEVKVLLGMVHIQTTDVKILQYLEKLVKDGESKKDFSDRMMKILKHFPAAIKSAEAVYKLIDKYYS